MNSRSNLREKLEKKMKTFSDSIIYSMRILRNLQKLILIQSNYCKNKLRKPREISFSKTKSYRKSP
jgi:hypothetical protein